MLALPWLIALSVYVSAEQYPIIPDEAINVQTPDTPSAWNCSIRGWVRAADLPPSSVIPAQVRLSANGTNCSDIIGMAVGLRLKERAIVKLKNSSVEEWPVKPVRPKMNYSSPGYDYNDIFRSQGLYFGSRSNDAQSEYDDAMMEYNQALSEPSLWKVLGVEREVFDIQLEMPLIDGTLDMDIVQPFFIHTPATNFPPIEDSTHSSQMINGDDEQLLNAETLSEYYLTVSLRNGTKVDVPAGRAGFIPITEHVPERAWPQELALVSPRKTDLPGKDEEEDWFRPSSRTPPCDADNRATFNITVNPTPAIVTQGGNITLNITLRRSGTGSEYPSVLNVNYRTDKDLDWAKNHLQGEGYEELLGSASEKGIGRFRSNDYMAGRMLAIKPMWRLKKEREMRDKSGGGASWSAGLGRDPLRIGQGRYDFEAQGGGGVEVSDKYEFQVEIQTPYDTLPSFNGTFHSFQPRLSFRLQTIFLCLDTSSSTTELGKDISRDNEWMEAELPSIKSLPTMAKLGPGLEHKADLDIDVYLPPPSRTDKISAVSYLDPSAQKPVLSLTEKVTSGDFGRVSITQREESQAELRRSRYNQIDWDRYNACGGRRCNIGGEYQHAAKMWQSKELLDGSEGDDKDKEVAYPGELDQFLDKLDWDF